jgi:hypothetical protein
MSAPGSLATLGRLRRTRRVQDGRAEEGRVQEGRVQEGRAHVRLLQDGAVRASHEALGCELCNEPIEATHGHLVDLHARSLLCACRACHLLFSNPGAGSGQLRAVPETIWVVEDLQLGPARWASLEIPVSTAFFFSSSVAGRVVAFFPGPAGATECLLPLDAWSQVVADNPVLATLASDVEAALVRVEADDGDPAPAQCFLVPIDVCYELVGVLRRSWHGLHGGPEAQGATDAFFARLSAAARRVGRADTRA